MQLQKLDGQEVNYLVEKKLEGIIQAISRYDFHYKNNKWDYPTEYYTNKFVDIEI